MHLKTGLSDSNKDAITGTSASKDTRLRGTTGYVRNWIALSVKALMNPFLPTLAYPIFRIKICAQGHSPMLPGLDSQDFSQRPFYEVYPGTSSECLAL